MAEVENKVQRYEKYKDSRVEWLGEIPLNWGLQKLKSFLTVHGRIGFRGYTVNDLVSKGEGAVTISPSNMGESNMIWDKVSYLSWQKYYESPEIIVEEGDLLIVKTASIGKIAYVRELKEKATINPQILILKNVKINKDFFYYQLVSRVFQHQLETEKIGSTIYTISENKILNFRAIIPPLPEQTKIAQFLDDKTTKIDDAIAIKEQQINLLKERKQILIHKAVTRGLDDNVTLKDSGVEWIGEIPEHWEVKRLKYLTRYFKGFAFSSIDFKNIGIPIVKASNIKNETIENVSSFIASDNQKNRFENFKLTEGDIIISTVGSKPEIRESAVGQLAIIEDAFSGSYLNQNTVCIRIASDLIFKYFLKNVFVSKYMRSNFDRISLWIANQAYIEVKSILEIFIALPPLSEQKEISAYIETASQKIERAIGLKQQEIAKLKEYKSSLINGVVTGKVRVC